MSGMTGVLAEAVGMGLLHFTWIGLVIGSVMSGLLYTLRGRSPQLRYAVALSGFVLLALVPSVTVYRNLTVPASRPAEHAGSREDRLLVSFAGSEGSDSSRRRSDFSSAGNERDIAASVPQSTSPSVLGPWREWVSSSARRAAPWIAAGWLVGVVGLGLRLLAGMFHSRTLGRRGAFPLDTGWRTRLDELMSKAGMRRTVRVFQSSIATVPLVVGWFRPVILMPATVFTGLPAKQVELLLAHELAHIKRLDPLVNLLQAAVEILLFFHPVVWWLSRRVREERELCCDDVAVAMCGGRREYAQALLQLAESTLPSPALILSARGGTLRRRINRVLGVPVAREGMGLPGVAGIFALTLCGLLVTGLAWAEFLRESAIQSTAAQPAAQIATAERMEPPGGAMEARSEPALVEAGEVVETPVLILKWPFDNAANFFHIEAEEEREEPTPLPEEAEAVETLALVDSGPAVVQIDAETSEALGSADLSESPGLPMEHLSEVSSQAPAASPKKDQAQLPADADEEKMQHLARQLAEKVNMELEDITLDELLDFIVKGSKIEIELLDSPGRSSAYTIEQFSFKDGTLAEALDLLLPTIGLAHRVASGQLLVGTPEQINGVMAPNASQSIAISTPPLVTDQIGREHVFTVLDRWAKSNGQYIYLDPFVVGAVRGPDGEPFATDGMVGPADFDKLPLTEALRALLTPLGLAFTQVDRESFPRIYVTTPEGLAEIEKGVVPYWTVEVRALLVPNATAEAIVSQAGTETFSVSGDATHTFRLPEHSEWLDNWENGRLVEETAELLTAPRLTLTDSRAWWGTTLYKVIKRSDRVLSPMEKALAERTHRGLETLPAPGCFFTRGPSRIAAISEIAFSGIYGTEDLVKLPHEDRVDPLVEEIFRHANAGLVADLVRHPICSESSQASNRERRLLRAGRRAVGVATPKPVPDSAYHQGFLFACSVSKSGEKYDLGFFGQYRLADSGQAPWRAFQSDLKVGIGEYVGFVSPSDTEGMWIVTVVSVAPVDERSVLGA